MVTSFYISKFYRVPFDEYNSKLPIPIQKLTLYPVIESAVKEPKLGQRPFQPSHQQLLLKRLYLLIFTQLNPVDVQLKITLLSRFMYQLTWTQELCFTVLSNWNNLPNDETIGIRKHFTYLATQVLCMSCQSPASKICKIIRLPLCDKCRVSDQFKMLTLEEAMRRNPMVEAPLDLPFCYHVKPGNKKQDSQRVKVYYEF